MWPCSSGSRAVLTRDCDDNDGVVFGSDDLLPHSGFGVFSNPPPFFPFSLFSLGLGAQWMATTVAAGRWDELGLRGWGFYSQARPWSSVIGGWRPRGDRRRTLASNGARVVAWARRKGRQGHAPGVIPWPAPAIAVGTWSEKNRRGEEESTVVEGG